VPTDVAVGSDGSVWFLQFRANRIGRFKDDRRCLRPRAILFSRASNLRISATGRAGLKQIALHFRAAQTEEHFSLFSVSTPSAVVVMFRALAMLMTACTIGDEPWAPAMSFDKASVDVDPVEWNPLQIAQRRIAGSEIVQRDTHADGAKCCSMVSAASSSRISTASGNLEFNRWRTDWSRQRIGDLQRKCVTPKLHRAKR